MLRTKISKPFTLLLHTFTLLSFPLLALFFKTLLLQADSLLPLELDTEVDFLHDASVKSNSAIEFLDSDDTFFHLAPNALKRVHQSLQANLA